MAKSSGYSKIPNLGVPNTFPGKYVSKGGRSGNDSTGPNKNVPGPMGSTKKGMGFKDKNSYVSFPQLPSSYTPVKPYGGKGKKAGS